MEIQTGRSLTNVKIPHQIQLDHKHSVTSPIDLHISQSSQESRNQKFKENAAKSHFSLLLMIIVYSEFSLETFPPRAPVVVKSAEKLPTVPFIHSPPSLYLKSATQFNFHSYTYSINSLQSDADDDHLLLLQRRHLTIKLIITSVWKSLQRSHSTQRNAMVIIMCIPHEKYAPLERWINKRIVIKLPSLRLSLNWIAPMIIVRRLITIGGGGGRGASAQLYTVVVQLPHTNRIRFVQLYNCKRMGGYGQLLNRVGRWKGICFWRQKGELPRISHFNTVKMLLTPFRR